MLTFSARAPDVERVRALLAHIPGAAEKAISRALNAAVAKAKSEATTLVQGRYTVEPNEFKKSIKLLKASPKTLRAAFLVRGAAMRLSKFKHSQQGGLVTTEIVRGRAKQWPGSFIARVGGHTGIFSRKRDYSAPAHGRYAGRRKMREGTRGTQRGEVGGPRLRQKLAEAVTVSSARMAGYLEIVDLTLDLAGQKLEAELSRQTELFLSGKVT